MKPLLTQAGNLDYLYPGPNNAHLVSMVEKGEIMVAAEKGGELKHVSGWHHCGDGSATSYAAHLRNAMVELLKTTSEAVITRVKLHGKSGGIPHH